MKRNTPFCVCCPPKAAALCRDCFLDAAWENADEPQETYDTED